MKRGSITSSACWYSTLAAARRTARSFASAPSAAPASSVTPTCWVTRANASAATTMINSSHCAPSWRCWATATSWCPGCRFPTPISSTRSRRTTSTHSNVFSRVTRRNVSIDSFSRRGCRNAWRASRAVQTGRLTYRIVRSAELAKVALTDEPSATIDLEYLEQGLRGATDRAQFAQACERLLVHLHGLVKESVAAAGRQPDVLYLTGGMARATIVRSYLEREFPDSAVRRQRPFRKCHGRSDALGAATVRAASSLSSRRFRRAISRDMADRAVHKPTRSA